MPERSEAGSRAKKLWERSDFRCEASQRTKWLEYLDLWPNPVTPTISPPTPLIQNLRICKRSPNPLKMIRLNRVPHQVQSLQLRQILQLVQKFINVVIWKIQYFQISQLTNLSGKESLAGGMEKKIKQDMENDQEVIRKILGDIYVPLDYQFISKSDGS